MLFAFEKLDVWQNSKELCKSLYYTVAGFPRKEQFGLCSQITRAAISVASNIAEGTARKSAKDQAHFTQLAYSSLMEVACQIAIAHELNYVAAGEYSALRIRIEEISNKLNALRKSQLARAN